MFDNVHAVILAAGASRRLGRPKQLLAWQGRPLLEHALRNAGAVLDDRLVVVLGAQAGRIRAAVDFGSARIVDNPAWTEGIAASLRAGIGALPPSAEAALILLSDQPLIRAEHLRVFLNSWEQAPSRIAAGFYGGSTGVPAVFPAEYFEALLRLRGDRGAKAVLAKFADTVVKVPLPEAALDVDCGGDVVRLIGSVRR